MYGHYRSQYLGNRTDTWWKVGKATFGLSWTQQKWVPLFKYEMQKIARLPTFTLSSNVFHSPVPDDIFSRNYVWKGFYNLKGKNQPMNLTVNNYNVSTGRVNATLINSNTEFLLSGNDGCFGNA